MPRPTLAQLSIGTLIVVATTVALLAVSGATAVFAVAVLVAFAVTLGTLATALLMTASRRRRPAHPAAAQRPADRQPPAPALARQR
ncbi:hypothetical protein [Kitasatospora sp. GP82]|uniref:hypothetical protein n=1 Tax=Kitasatospora sp. GP82 TaxID=3035089 RepID=UPI0024743F81|nr:hypothetical protein [Kitasatospora sp. GP82]MDH6126661.1 hypothetical protein [Kitasatospora sp. GP82]